MTLTPDPTGQTIGSGSTTGREASGPLAGPARESHI